MMRHERERASARLDEDLIKCSVECHGSSAGCVAFGQATQSWRTCLGRTGVIDRLFAPRPCGRGQRRTASAYEAFGRRRPGRHPCLLLPLWPRRVGYPTIAFAIIAPFKVSRSKARRGIDRVPALGWLYSELACLSFEEFPMDRMATEILRFAPRGE